MGTRSALSSMSEVKKRGEEGPDWRYVDPQFLKKLVGLNGGGGVRVWDNITVTLPMPVHRSLDCFSRQRPSAAYAVLASPPSCQHDHVQPCQLYLAQTPEECERCIGLCARGSNYQAAGAGLSGSKMARRIGSIEEFEFKPVGENRNQGHLAVGILVSGFVFEEEDFIRPWEGMEDNLERYALQWESKHLIAVSTAIQDWITSRLTRELIKQGAMMTVLGTLVSALAWPAALLSATDFIDSRWSMAIDRSDKAGKLLAEALLKGLQGNRPVTLLGFSLGARVIFKCLQHLAESEDNEGLIERVVLLGAPISLKGEEWENARKMVAGRFVNVYSANDWILGVTFRASLLTQGLAGIQAVNVPGVENVDVTDLIEGHSSYLWTVREILAQLDLNSHCPVFTCPVPKSRD